MRINGTETACYTLLSITSDSKRYTEQKIKEDLQNENVSIKCEALKELIRNIINGEKYPNILMTVIRFVMPSQDHTIKKLLHLFWEVAPKYSADGKLLHEMILVCDAYRRDLQHPNEFVRGCTLRFLCKLKEPELLEPLMPSIVQCLDHRHAYVRRNAVLAIFTIYKNFDHLVPDAPERILNFLAQEQDPSCKRNAFLMLLHVSQGTAVEYLSSCIDSVETFSETMQLVVVELIHKVFRSQPTERMKFIRCVFSLLKSTCSSVRYEAATTLITLSGAAPAIRAAASCYIDLILKESDNNAKLVILNSLISLRGKHEKILQELVMDLVRILGASDIELRRKALELIVDLVTTRTADDLIVFLKKEILKASSSSTASAPALPSGDASNSESVTQPTNKNNDEDTYRFVLVRATREICLRFPSALPTILPALCDVLTYTELQDSKASIEICRLLRDTIYRHPQHRASVLGKVMQLLPSVAGYETLRHLLWICGEFCFKEEIAEFMLTVHKAIPSCTCVSESNGISPFHSTPIKNSPAFAMLSHLPRPVIPPFLPLGSTLSNQQAALKRPVIQAALFANSFMSGIALSVSLVKIFCRYLESLNETLLSTTAEFQRRKNKFAAECLLIISSMVHLARSGLIPHRTDPDVIERMWLCLVAIAEARADVIAAVERLGHDTLGELLDTQEAEQKANAKKKQQQQVGDEASEKTVDAGVDFTLLSAAADPNEQVDHFALTLSQALGSAAKPGDAYATSKLKKIHQLTGFSDPVYAEAFVSVNQFDIALDVLLVNQTNDTLQNLTLELSTLGDLKLVEKPRPLTLAAQDFANICANIKVSSTENGIIFGNIVYDIRGSAGESNYIVLSDIHIDILEYIQPATCSNSEFRQMWSDFEWENKVTVNTQVTDLRTYMTYVTKITNFRCLTPPEALRGDCNYFCATLYACSVFGEHVLASLCLEKPADDQPVSGHVRIRAKTQGMAVTMGEKVCWDFYVATTVILKISSAQKLWHDAKPGTGNGKLKDTPKSPVSPLETTPQIEL
ncbi:unnamed protein product [Dibothriocephalus latus]|uniref:Coatomer subunit beta n=1 Tax=Dibothriocephalus latus TaxID=60516 RepID=A0A3P6TKW5_DIBLA|nr:unnamed protein product [Dibothriocephalus latus]